jgi:hypothetical protein
MILRNRSHLRSPVKNALRKKTGFLMICPKSGSPCKMHGINPEEYLKDVLSRLPHITNTEARELTPVNWLAARQAESRTA